MNEIMGLYMRLLYENKQNHIFRMKDYLNTRHTHNLQTSLTLFIQFLNYCI